MPLRSFKLVEEFIRERNASAGVALVGYKGVQYGPAFFGTTGFFPGAPAVTADTIFDLASLTKVVGTTTAALGLLGEGVFHLQSELGDLLEDVPRDKAGITVQQLLSHTSGLAATAPLYLRAKGPDDVIEQILHSPLEYETGSQVVYSCLGFILLGRIMERFTKRALDHLVTERVLTPLQMHDSFYNPPQDVQARIAFTEWCPRTKRFLRGTVHDENAQAMGGISGNAGLFSTASDLGKLADMILQGGTQAGHTVLDKRVVGWLDNCYTEGLNERRTLGWMLHSKPSSGGNLLSPSSLGHTGFTGTSIWIDRERELYSVLLTNRVHPVRTNESIFQLRPAFHDSVISELT